MTTMTVEEFAEKMQVVLEQIAGGDEVILTRDSRAIARLSGVTQNNSKAVYGALAGKMWIADDFDEPLDDFKEYM